MPYWFTSVARRWARMACSLYASTATVGCSSSDLRSRPDVEARATMVEHERIALGRDAATSVAEVSYASYARDRLAVVDRVARRTHVYDRGGNLLWQVREHDGPPRPNGLAWKHDSLLLVDVSATNGVWVLEMGRHVRTVPLALSGTPTGIAAASGRLLVASTSSDEAVLAGEAASIFSVPDSGGALGSGCPVHGLYKESLQASGMASIFRANGVVARESTVLCWQPLAPFVWLVGPDMQSTDSIDLRSFVPAPRHMRASMDLISINKFREQIGEITGVMMSQAFVHVVVASFDAIAGRDRYLVARCRSGASASCEGFNSETRPIGVVSDDTLLAVAHRQAGDTTAHVVLLTYPVPQ